MNVRMVSKMDMSRRRSTWTLDGLESRSIWEPNTGCLLWMGAVTSHGYGYVGRRRHLVHRMMFQFTHGPIPPGMFICHRCDNPPCINPGHLFLGTPRDNMVDMVNKGRDRSRGAKNTSALLTADAVRAVREQCARGEMHMTLAKEFGVSRQTVGNITTGRTWRHLA